MPSKMGRQYIEPHMDSTEAMVTAPWRLRGSAYRAIGGLLVSSLLQRRGQKYSLAKARELMAWPRSRPPGRSDRQPGYRRPLSDRETLAAVHDRKGHKAKAEEYVSRATGAALSRGHKLRRDLAGQRERPSGLRATAPSCRSQGLYGLDSPELSGQAAAMAAGSSLAAEGRPKASFMVQFAGTLVNAVLAPIFIFALGLGVGGAGLAVALAQTFSSPSPFAYVSRRKARSKSGFATFFLNLSHRGAYSRWPSPLPFQLLTCATFVVANIGRKTIRGRTGPCGRGIIVTVAQFLGFPLFGIITGAQPLWVTTTGRQVGSDRTDSISTFGWTLVLAFVSELAMVAAPAFFVSLLGRPILGGARRPISAHFRLRLHPYSSRAWGRLLFSIDGPLHARRHGDDPPMLQLHRRDDRPSPLLGFDGVLWRAPFGRADRGSRDPLWQGACSSR